MKIRYEEIIKANEPLSILSKEKVSVKEAVGIARIIKVFREEFVIYQEKERELLNKYCEPTENGGFKCKDEETAMAFNKDFKELLDFEVDLAVEPVKLVSDIKVDAETILLIDKFIDFE